MESYVALPGFENVVLEESFVLRIEAELAVVLFDLDLVLAPGHPAYRPPRPPERECFLLGTLKFSGVRRLEWGGQGVIRPAIDALGRVDYGHIDSLLWESDRYLLEGEWGSMQILADGVALRYTS